MSLETLGDADLVARACDGDMDAFTALYRRHVDTVHDHVARWTQDRALAADATQEAFVTLLKRLDSLRDGQAVLAWLMRTARNRAVDQLRLTQREHIDPAAADLIPASALATVSADRAGTPERAAEATEAAELLWSVAAGLDERTFAVLDLTVRHGLNGPELAVVLDTTPANANVLVHRMRERVRSLFFARLLLRDASDACLDLAAVGRTLPDTIDVPAARAVESHVDSCATCEPRRRRAVAPMRAYAAFAEVRAPASVRIAIETAVQAQIAGPPSGRGRLIATAVGAVLLVLAGASIIRGDLGDDGPPVAVGVALGTASEPATDPTPGDGDPTAQAVATDTPTEAPTVAPTPTAAPTALPTEEPTRAPLAASIASPLPESVLVATTDPTGAAAAAQVTLDGVVSGADQQQQNLQFVWTSDRSAQPLSTQLRDDVRLAVSERCVDAVHMLTLTVTNSQTGEVARDSLPVTVTEACPEPLDVRILEPADGTEVATRGFVTGTTRQTVDVNVRGEAADDPRGSFTYSWRSNQDPGATLLDARAGTVTLWVDGCDPVVHVLTLSVTDPATGAVGDATISVTVRPTCTIG